MATLRGIYAEKLCQDQPVNINYADGQTWIRRGLSAVGTLAHSCSAVSQRTCCRLERRDCALVSGMSTLFSLAKYIHAVYIFTAER
jgi:hypothetical protein